MNKQFIRCLDMIIAIAAMFAWLAVCWVGIEGLGSHFSWAGLAVVGFASQYIRNWANPIPIAAYVHAMSALSWPPVTAALFAASPLVLMRIGVHFSIARGNRPDWGVAWISILSILVYGLMLCLTIAMLAGGFEEIHHGIGLVWAVVAFTALMCRLRFGVFGIGAYLHATGAWGWNPAIAILFVAGPTLCFLIGCHLNQRIALYRLLSLTGLRRRG